MYDPAYLYYKKGTSVGANMYAVGTSGASEYTKATSISQLTIAGRIGLMYIANYIFVNSLSGGIANSCYYSIYSDPGSSSSGIAYSSMVRDSSGDLGTSSTVYNWKKDGTTIQPSAYYLSISGTPSVNDTIIVTYNTHY